MAIQDDESLESILAQVHRANMSMSERLNHYLRARGLLWGVRHDLLGEAYAPTEEDVEGLMQAFVRQRDQSLMELRSLAVKLGVTDRWRAAIDKEIAGTSSEG